MYPIRYNTFMVAKKIKIFIYRDKGDKEPFTDWLRRLAPVHRARILKRIERFEIGAFGDHKVVKGASGVFEARFFFGAGYRVYFGKDGSSLVILLAGGDKKSQKKDTSVAQEYWRIYCDRKESG